ncbi:CidA/LrgA family protein [Klebsiella variicola]|uniref:CidA/LrgA family protein n=1 Tax=Klebsiella variicola TaxID=244366 RepID=UPI0022E2F42C|nr:CidA/LrgA family protein [Klebsiella variicola]
MAFAPARVAPVVAQRLQIPLQVLLYVGLFIFAQYLVNRWQVPLPANLVGMVMLLLLIVCRVIPLSWIRAGARWLLAEMLLFFVPAVVAVVNYTQLLMVDGWRIFLVIALSTLMVLGATAWVVDRVYRYEVSRLKNE